MHGIIFSLDAADGTKPAEIVPLTISNYHDTARVKSPIQFGEIYLQLRLPP
jgi:hypothetical protein